MTTLFFLLDENVPVSVAAILKERGHDAMTFAESGLAKQSKDQMVANTSIISNRILISSDNDMTHSRKKTNIPKSQHRKLHLLFLKCKGTSIPSRVKEVIGFIEREWVAAKGYHSQKFYVEIGQSYCKSYDKNC